MYAGIQYQLNEDEQKKHYQVLLRHVSNTKRAVKCIKYMYVTFHMTIYIKDHTQSPNVFRKMGNFCT